MKSNKIFLAVIVVLCSLPKDSHAQIIQNNFIGISWKVNEFYVNKVKRQGSSIDSLRCFFTKTALELRSPQSTVSKSTLNYSFSAIDSVLSLSDGTLMKVKYADLRNFILVDEKKDKASGRELIVEIRMIPE